MWIWLGTTSASLHCSKSLVCIRDLFIIPSSTFIAPMLTNKSNLRGFLCITKVFIKIGFPLPTMRSIASATHVCTPPMIITTATHFLFCYSFLLKIMQRQSESDISFSIHKNFSCGSCLIYILLTEEHCGVISSFGPFSKAVPQQVTPKTARIISTSLSCC